MYKMGNQNSLSKTSIIGLIFLICVFFSIIWQIHICLDFSLNRPENHFFLQHKLIELTEEVLVIGFFLEAVKIMRTSRFINTWQPKRSFFPSPQFPPPK
jgi:hypothetical protein